LFSVWIDGQFINPKQLDQLNTTEFIINYKFNILNTTVMNIKYGIVDRILPFSLYNLKVIASNTKGQIESNTISVKTFPDKPDLVLPPELVKSEWCSLTIKWSQPILINSDDQLIYYQVEYRIKALWNEQGPIYNDYFENFKNIFAANTLATVHTLNNLNPFTGFSFRLVASNTFGTSVSHWSEMFTTNETNPMGQNSPLILNFGSRSAELNWTPPNASNGIINIYTIDVYKVTNNNRIHLVHTIPFENDYTYKFIVTNLIPFTFYVFSIEACNSVGCVSSIIKQTTTSNDTTLIRTKAAEPELILPPILDLPTKSGFCIGIKWSEPLRPNGIISYYILERKDSFINSTHHRRYKFYENNTFEFLDYEGLQSCLEYSYRVTAINEIGNITSNWSTIRVKKSAPLIVTAPLIFLLNSTTARFEWIKPLTFCEVKIYFLKFESEKGRIFDFISYTENILIDKYLEPFNFYNVTLQACVSRPEEGANMEESCTSSLSKKFQMLGTVPDGLSVPIAKLISFSIISIEWLQPLLKNGFRIEYQVIRRRFIKNNNDSQTTETVYFGIDNYFLDFKISNDFVYQYRVVYTNEYGNALSEWSNFINMSRIQNYSTTATACNLTINDKIINGSNISIINNIEVVYKMPTFVLIKWTIYTKDQLKNYLNKLINITNSTQLSSYKRIIIQSETITAESKLETLSYNAFVNNDSGSTNQTKNKLLNNLTPGIEYSFKVILSTRLVLEDSTETLTPNNIINLKFTSETIICTTISVQTAFNSSTLLKINKLNGTFISLNYNLSDLIFFNYNLILLQATNKQLETNQSLLFNLNSAKNGSLIFGSFYSNNVYEFKFTACSIISNNKNENCLQSQSFFYSSTTKEPSKIRDISLRSLNSTSIELKWSKPLHINDYSLNYLIYRKKEDNQRCENLLSFQNETQISCNGKIYQFKGSNYECCGKNYLLNSYKTFDCCGGRFYIKQENYQCCSDLYYVNVPPGQICCSSNGENDEEIRFNLGIGNKCCANLPYSHSSSPNMIQKCCNDKLVPSLLSTSNINYNYKLFMRNKCQIDVDCLGNNFNLIYNKTLPFEELEFREINYFIDNNEIEAFSRYKYRFCSSNRYPIETCNNELNEIKTKPSIPVDFYYFNYKSIQNSIYFEWNPPLYLNDAQIFYKLYRNGNEIYNTTAATSFIDTTSRTENVNTLKYELKVCNTIGCIHNENNLFIDNSNNSCNFSQLLTIEKYKTTNTSIGVEISSKNWSQLPIIDRIIIEIIQINLEIQILFDFNVIYSTAPVEISTKLNKDYIIHLSIDILQNNKSIVININDLTPNTDYNLQMRPVFKSNKCLFNESLVNFETNSSFIFNFMDPFIYILNDTSVDIVWREPMQSNGHVTVYRLLKNGQTLVEFNRAEIELSFDYFLYRDNNLKANTYYSYQIQVINSGNFKNETNKMLIQTPMNFNFNNQKQCQNNQIEDVWNDNRNIEEAALTILNLVNMKFKVESSSQIQLTYNLNEWYNLVKCLLFNFNVPSHFELLDKSIFSIKIILQSKINGLQPIEFPFPSTTTTNDSNETIHFSIKNLTASSNYSIRISLFNVLPRRQILTTLPVHLRTFDSAPCCQLDAPIVVEKYNYFSVKWKRPIGKNTTYILTRIKLNDNGCFNNKTNDNESTKIELNSTQLIYDKLNNFLIYTDKSNELNYDFSNYAYKIEAFNSFGSIESNWSRIFTSKQNAPPSPPLDAKITDSHSTGFILNFKKPKKPNGFISHFTIIVEDYPLFLINNGSKKEFILNNTEPFKCDKNESASIGILLNGLKPFSSYKITITATNFNSQVSKESEKVIGNTLQSSPAGLRPLIIYSTINDDQKITLHFKLNEPRATNGILLKFNVFFFIQKRTKSDDKIMEPIDSILIYSGLEKYFNYTNLLFKPFENYEFAYEACTSAGCSRQLNKTRIRTLETKPLDLKAPTVYVVYELKPCAKIEWSPPMKPNGLIQLYQIYRQQDDDIERLISHNITSQVNNYNDCYLEPYRSYKYKIMAWNSVGNVASNYSQIIKSHKILPNGFSNLIASQINDTTVKLEWLEPSKPNGLIIYYLVYRNSKLLSNSTSSSTMGKHHFYDISNFKPNELYIYVVYACTVIGCSTDPSKSSAEIRIKTYYFNNQIQKVKTKKWLEFGNYPLLIDVDPKKRSECSFKTDISQLTSTTIELNWTFSCFDRPFLDNKIK
jgi:hypothetical protein